ncbi:sugar ABC transporter permease, partial [Pseudomonas sp. FW301-21B01]
MHALELQAARTRPRQKPLQRRLPLAAWLALLPMVLTVVFAYLGTMVWTARVSLSNSRTFPSGDFAGFTQYARLFHNDRWLLSLQN